MSKTRRASKSNTRAKRQARAKASRESRRDAVAQRAAEQRLEELFGADTPPRRSAELIIERLGAGAVPAGISRFFIVAGSTERAREVSEAVTELSPDSVCALSFAADVAAHLDRDDRMASQLLDRALALTDDDANRVTLADHLVRLGRAADALSIVEELHLDDPQDDDLEAIRAAALMLAWQRASAGPDDEHLPDECPCWSDRPWLECCQPAEAAAIARFDDRSELTQLQIAIERYVDGEPVLRAAVADDVRRCLEASTICGEPVADAGEVTRIGARHAWLIGAEDLDPEPGQLARFDPDSPLASFAGDPSTPSRQAAQARRWLENCSYGLWQVREPIAEPGVWLTELVTGVSRYAALPAELLARASRWSVLLGGLVAIDGTWRPAADLILLRPGEADESAELVEELSYKVVSSASGTPLRRPRGSDMVQPHGVLASLSDPSSPEVSRFVSMVIGSGIPQLLAYIAEMRNAQPKLVNTDKHPTVLIKATVAVNDGLEVTARLADHPEFDVEDGAIKWWGRELDAMERETSLAELRAWLKEQGEDPALAAESEGPQRWLRGSISIGDGTLEIDVNSRERFDRLLSLLADVGGAPDVVAKLVIDPAQDMALPHLGSVLPGSSSEEGNEAWRRHWPDQKLPALGGMTPRQAARSERRKPWLEAMLRELEHDADRLARHGRPAPDVDGLRAELAMPATAFS
ncbi:MAG TPA: hypothetical protein VGN29_08300 [Solirubrobacteraceae bacterium]|nr:hypothetical protein [Solirubrobacteraceae bacterium]